MGATTASAFSLASLLERVKHRRHSNWPAQQKSAIKNTNKKGSCLDRSSTTSEHKESSSVHKQHKSTSRKNRVSNNYNNGRYKVTRPASVNAMRPATRTTAARIARMAVRTSAPPIISTTIAPIQVAASHYKYTCTMRLCVYIGDSGHNMPGGREARREQPLDKQAAAAALPLLLLPLPPKQGFYFRESRCCSNSLVRLSTANSSSSGNCPCFCRCLPKWLRMKYGSLLRSIVSKANRRSLSFRSRFTSYRNAEGNINSVVYTPSLPHMLTKHLATGMSRHPGARQQGTLRFLCCTCF